MKIIGFFSGSQKYFFLCFFLFTSFSCKDDPVKPPDNVDFSIAVEDVSCIEAWISLKAANASELKLFRNDSLIKTINTFPLDTVMYDEGLLPSQSYIYKADVLFNNKTYTKEASAKTMDTTSHDFTWQSWEFGQHSSSVLFDVAIIDKNNIWAVGEIYMNDSLGNPDNTPYNAVHWDGENWELKRILYLNGFAPITAIYAFNENDIWFGIGYTIHWDGNIFKEMEIPDWHIRINEIWGNTSNNIYVVGNNGSIAHYDGLSWKKIESGTDLNLTDVWGAYNKRTRDYEILSTASSLGQSLDKALIKIDTYNAFRISIEPVLSTLGSVWFIPERKYYLVGGSGVYEKNSLRDSLWKERPAVVYNYPHVVRGNNFNDVFVAGSFGDLAHFNGKTWKNLRNEIALPGAVFGSISIKENIVVIAGYSGRKGVIIKGIKN